MQPKDKMGKYTKNTLMNKVKYVFNRIIWKIQNWIG
jgi:hypothetical protein